jgi:hypothetical protein
MLEPVLRAQKDTHLDFPSVEKLELVPYTIAEGMSYCINVHFAKPSCPKQSSPSREDTGRAMLFLVLKRTIANHTRNTFGPTSRDAIERIGPHPSIIAWDQARASIADNEIADNWSSKCF